MRIAMFLFVALALPVLAGCHEKLSDDKAAAIIRNVAAEIARNEGMTEDQKVERVRHACTMEGVTIDAFARHLKDNPDVTTRLAEEIRTALQEQLEGRLKQYDTELAEMKKRSEAALAQARVEHDQRRSELQAAHDKRMADLEVEFKNREKELQEAIAAVRNQ